MYLSEVAIFTDAVDELAAFYERLLGVPPMHRGDGIAIFPAGAAHVLIHRRYVPGPDDLPCENHIAFAVPDVDAGAAELQARGLTLEVPPRDFPWGRSAYLRDPEGRLVELQAAHPA
jgi:catechol 2,3-dioxygenase-like lactoylglutathione lyase family enzyme